MYGDNLLEFLQRIFFDGGDRAIVAGVVDEDVDRSKFFAGSLKNAFAIGFLGKVCGRESCIAARRVDFSGRGRELGFGAGGEKCGCALSGEEVGDSAAYATTRAGDE